VFAADICTRLAASGFGVVGQSILYGRTSEPHATLALAITVVDTGGMAGLRTHNRVGESYGRPSAQVTVRATKLATALATAETVRADLDSVRNEMIGSTRYLEIASMAPAGDLGPDAAGRARVSFNVMAVREA
jgi:hypothetical protein